MTQQLTLTRGLVALVDDEDFPAVRIHNWQARISQNTAYAVRADLGQSGLAEGLHRFLTGWPLVDHINGDGLDNRRANLRPATWTQNAWNRTKRRRAATSRYKGVSRSGRVGKPWRVDASVDGQQNYVGCFADEVEAALAYDAVVRATRGAFAALNFPEVGERAALLPIGAAA